MRAHKDRSPGVAVDCTQRGAAAELERAVTFHGAIDRPGQSGLIRQTELVIDEPDVECGVVSREKLVGVRKHRMYVGGVC